MPCMISADEWEADEDDEEGEMDEDDEFEGAGDEEKPKKKIASSEPKHFIA